MFPQEYRSTIIGICNIIARAVTVLSPMINELPEPQPMIFLMSVTAIAFINSFFLKVPEEAEQEAVLAIPVKGQEILNTKLEAWKIN